MLRHLTVRTQHLSNPLMWADKCLVPSSQPVSTQSSVWEEKPWTCYWLSLAFVLLLECVCFLIGSSYDRWLIKKIKNHERTRIWSSKGFITHQSRMKGFPGGIVVKNLPVSEGGSGLIPGSERSPGGGNNNPLQYSCLGNPMDRGTWYAAVHGAAKSQTQLSNWTTKNPI